MFASIPLQDQRVDQHVHSCISIGTAVSSQARAEALSSSEGIDIVIDTITRELATIIVAQEYT
jgi:hypothetical protein